MDERLMGAIVGVIAGLLAAGIVYVFFRKNKYKNFITGLFFGILFFSIKIYILPYYYAATYESTIRNKYPIYEVIAKYYPKEFNQYITQERKNILENGSLSNGIQYSAELVNNAILKSIPFASPESIYNYVKITLKMEKKMYLINPAWVISLEFPGRDNRYTLSSIVNSISENDIKERMQAEKDLIESGSKNRMPIKLTDEESNAISQDLIDLLTNLKKQYGEEEVANTFSNAPFIDEQKSAQIIISFYEDILEKGEQRGGWIVKALYLLSLSADKK